MPTDRCGFFRVSFSIGVAKVEKIETYETLYARVDHAMYQAKNKGKNRIEIAEVQTTFSTMNPTNFSIKKESNPGTTG